ncbi:MAG TPA: hypothetical protein V6D08_17625 [Candidatus Obscuribacterales bacterium]
MSTTSGAIQALSHQQRETLDRFAEEIIARSNSTEPCDRKLVEDAIRALYTAVGCEPPAIAWCGSPAELVLMPLALECLFVPERRPVLESLLAPELLDSILVKLCRQYSPAFDAYETLVRPHDTRALCQIELAQKLNHLLRKTTLRHLQRRYRSKIASEADRAVSERLQGPLLRSILPRTQTIRAALAQQLNSQLNSRRRLWPATLWNLPAAEDSQAYLALLDTESDPRRSGNVPFAMNVLLADKRWRERAWAESARSMPDPELEAMSFKLFWLYQNVHCGWSSLPWLSQHQYARMCIDDRLYLECDSKVLDAWWAIAANAWAFSCHEFVCFVTDRPLALHLDELNRLHHGSKAALEFEDRSKVHAWHGVCVPPRVIEAPEQITVNVIDAERNAEVRRVMLERFGVERYLRECGAERVHDDDFGTLYRKSYPVVPPRGWPGRAQQEEPLVFVKVVNSTPELDGSFRAYFLRVPPHVSTAREAVAWTFGMEVSQYAPVVET